MMQESDGTLLPSGDLKGALTSIFGPLGSELLAELSREVEIVDLAGGTALFRQNEPTDSLYILLHGRLNVSSMDPETGVETLLGETAPGESIGEIGLLTGEPRSASLWATSRRNQFRFFRAYQRPRLG
jgi:NTE family protein